MGILDQLLEKKDLNIYLDLRIKHLKKVDVHKFPAKNRAYLAERMKGRIQELIILKTLLSQDKIKETDIRYWRKIIGNKRDLLFDSK
jgi:hypothetical protein